MYLFWHAVFALLLALATFRLIKPNPGSLFILVTAFFGVFPDLDHLLCWNPEFLTKLIPRHLTEGLAFNLRPFVYPCYLHLWLWPLIVITATILAKKRKHRELLLAMAVGWGLHLALDGVIVIL
jgi:hypothetical protein